MMAYIDWDFEEVRRTGQTSTMTKLLVPKSQSRIPSPIPRVYLQGANRAWLRKVMRPCHAIASGQSGLSPRPSCFQCMVQKGTDW
jgi:uncharacterized protein YecT (DUF1311 family)